jgi:hypothetical protein
MLVVYQAYIPPNARELFALIGHHYSSCPIKRLKNSLLSSHDYCILYIIHCGNSYSDLLSTSYNYIFLSSWYQYVHKSYSILFSNTFVTFPVEHFVYINISTDIYYSHFWSNVFVPRLLCIFRMLYIIVLTLVTPVYYLHDV